MELEATLAHGVVGAAGQGRFTPAARADFAEAATAVLTDQAHETNVAYELGGDEALTMDEAGALASIDLGRRPTPAEIGERHANGPGLG